MYKLGEECQGVESILILKIGGVIARVIVFSGVLAHFFVVLHEGSGRWRAAEGR